VGAEIAFPVMDEMPDCETCEPAEPWSQANKGFVLLINVLTGKRVRACMSCVEAGILRQVLLEPPENGYRPALGAIVGKSDGVSGTEGRSGREYIGRRDVARGSVEKHDAGFISTGV
jgi:hypothetical protein